MDLNQPIVKLKLDVIFKRVFGDENNTDIIAAFLSALLEIPRESIEKITLNNVEIAPEYLEQKFSRLDMKMDVDGKTVNVEMQVNYEPDFRERTLFYWSKLYSEELKTGDEYGSLKRTVCINLIDFNLFDCEDYHSQFSVMENSRHEVLTDKLAIHFFELKKSRKYHKNSPMDEWLDLINAETEGDLMEIQNSTVIPEVNKTILIIRNLSGDEKIRQEAYYREKRLHDEATALGHARREGIAQGRAEGLTQGRAEGLTQGRAEGLTQGRAEGLTQGRAEGLTQGRAETIREMTQRMRDRGMTDDEIKAILGE